MTTATSMQQQQQQDKGRQNDDDRHHRHQDSYDYQYCSREECEERQTLGQVNELESTIETCNSSQNRRILDPRYAVPKYRRSAAAGGVSHSVGGSGRSGEDGRDDSTSSSRRRRRSASQLSSTLDHLIFVMAYRRASKQHPQVEDLSAVLSFLIDRLRAVQADATRLLSSSSSSSSLSAGPLPATFHLKLLRLLIWIRFVWDVRTVAVVPSKSSAGNTNSSNSSSNSNTVDSLTPRTIQTMISTSIEMYWGMRELDGGSSNHNNNDGGDHNDDDEVMCYSTMIQISTISLTEICSNNGSSTLSSSSSVDDGGNWNRLIFDFNKRQKQLSSNNRASFPLWHEALRVASYASRQEFYYMFHGLVKSNSNFPVLARCCCAPTLFAWRYRTVQQYNVTFGKKETISDLQHLLGIHDNDWTMDYAKEFGGIPVSLRDNSDFDEWDDKDYNDNDNLMSGGSIEVTMKAVAIPNLVIQKSSFQCCSKERLRSTRRWIFGESYNETGSIHGDSVDTTASIVVDSIIHNR